MAREFSHGSVRKHKGMWQATISYQDDNGKQKRLAKSTGVECDEKSNRGKATAEDFLRRWRDQLVRDEEKRLTLGSTSTLVEHVDDFIATREGNKKVEESTLATYRTHRARLLGSPLANMPISDITHKDIELFEQGLYEEGLSSSTLSHIHIFLKQVMNKARKAGDIASNPFDLVDAPRRVRKPVNALDKEGLRLLNRKLFEYEEGPFRLAVKIALMTGMRQAEICALKWKDIDFSRNELRVDKAQKRVKGCYVLGPVKTESSNRTIPFGPALRAELEQRLAACKEACEKMDIPWFDDNYVVGSPIDGSFFNPQVLGKKWHMFSRLIGLKGTQEAGVRFHDLRHTFATHAIASGQDVKTVSVILGHANAAMTLNIYSDALEDSKRQSMDVLDGILSVA